MARVTITSDNTFTDKVKTNSDGFDLFVSGTFSGSIVVQAKRTEEPDSAFVTIGDPLTSAGLKYINASKHLVWRAGALSGQFASGTAIVDLYEH